MPFEHAPGCDLKHSPRQQCPATAAPTDEATTTTVAAAGGQSTIAARPPWTRGRIIAGALLAAAVTATVVGIVTGALGGAPWASNRQDSSSLPDWARPSGAIELRNERDCRPDASWIYPCRTLEFGTQRAYEDVVGELKEAVEAHGFGAMIEGHDLSLHAFDRQREHCMLFYQDERPLPQTEESGYLTSRAGFAVVFDVVIDGCGAYYPS